MKLKLKISNPDLSSILKENRKHFFKCLWFVIVVMILAYFFFFRQKLLKLQEVESSLAEIRHEFSSEQLHVVNLKQQVIANLDGTSSLAIEQIFELFSAVGIKPQEVKRISTRKTSLPHILLQLKFTVNNRQWSGLIDAVNDAPYLLLADFKLSKNSQVEMELFVLLDRLSKFSGKNINQAMKKNILCYDSQLDVLSLADLRYWKGGQSDDIKITQYNK